MNNLLDLPLHVLIALWVVRNLSGSKKQAMTLDAKRYIEDNRQVAQVISTLVLNRYVSTRNPVIRYALNIVGRYVQMIEDECKMLETFNRQFGEVAIGFIPFDD